MITFTVQYLVGVAEEQEPKWDGLKNLPRETDIQKNLSQHKKPWPNYDDHGHDDVNNKLEVVLSYKFRHRPSLRTILHSVYNPYFTFYFILAEITKKRDWKS